MCEKTQKKGTASVWMKTCYHIFYAKNASMIKEGRFNGFSDE